MAPAGTYRSIPKQHRTRQLLLLLVFGLLLLVVVPLSQSSIPNSFQYLLSPLWSPPTVPPHERAVLKPPGQGSYGGNGTTKNTPTTKKRTGTGGLSAGSCDVYKGEWVRDPTALYYTNSSCSMIQENRNCLLFGKPNEGFQEWRWRPDDCELPRFDPKRFLEAMRGKSMAFVGDSLAKNHMQSLICILSSVDYPRDVSRKADKDSRAFFYGEYNFNISILWSPFLVKAALPPNGNLNGLWSLILDQPDGNWVDNIAGFDYVIMSDGNWLVKRSLYYEGDELVGCNNCHTPGVPDLTSHYGNRKVFRTAFRALNAKKEFKGMVILRTLSPDHFENGEFDTGGDCLLTRPFRRDEATLRPHVRQYYMEQVEEFREAAKGGRRRGLDYRLIDVTHAMLLRPDGHPSRYAHWPRPNVTYLNDCVHWCMPGPVDVWNEFLYQTVGVGDFEVSKQVPAVRT